MDIKKDLAMALRIELATIPVGLISHFLGVRLPGSLAPLVVPLCDAQYPRRRHRGGKKGCCYEGQDRRYILIRHQ